MKRGWTRVQARSLRVGDVLRTEDGPFRVTYGYTTFEGWVFVEYTDGTTIVFHATTYLTVNYPRP